jgi:hypothetical protein
MHHLCGGSMNMRFVVSFPVLLLLTVPSFAQDSSGGPGYWARLGAGGAGVDGRFGFGSTLGFQYSSSIGLIGVRYINSGETGADPATVGESRLTDVSEIGATCGLSTNISIIHFSVSTGIGVIWGTQENLSGREHFKRFALPLEGEITLRPLPVLGLGVVVSATLSSKANVVNPMVVLHFGRLR